MNGAVRAAAAVLVVWMAAGGCHDSGPTSTVDAQNDVATTAIDVAVTIDVLANDFVFSTASAFPLVISAVTQGLNGSITINANDTVTYTPNQGFTGTDTFTYTADNIDGRNDTATVRVVLIALPIIASRTDIAAGGLNPNAVAVGDLDGDSWPDLAVVNQTSDLVAVHLQNSNLPGTFLAPSGYATKRTPTDVAIGDLNSDGLPDLAVTDWVDGDVVVWFQDSIVRGRFVNPIVVTVGQNPLSIAIADFNSDGFMDFVTANASSDTISVVFQDPSTPGTFFTPIVYATGDQPAAVAVADLNGDLAADIAVANRLGNSVSVYLQDPGVPGDFLPPFLLLTGTQPTDVIASDLDGDGFVDLAAANSRSAYVSVFFQDGITPGSFLTGLQVPAGDAPTALAAGRLDADSYEDLVVATIGFGAEAVAAIAHNGSPPRTFLAPSNFNTTGNPADVELADIDKDGFLDWIVPNFGSNDVSILFGQ